MTTASIRYCGVALSCTFEFYPAEAQTRHDPGFPAYAVLESCKVGGVEILDMLERSQQDEIETLLADQMEEGQAEHEHSRRQERLMENQYP